MGTRYASRFTPTEEMCHEHGEQLLRGKLHRFKTFKLKEVKDLRETGMIVEGRPPSYRLWRGINSFKAKCEDGRNHKFIIRYNEANNIRSHFSRKLSDRFKQRLETSRSLWMIAFLWMLAVIGSIAGVLALFRLHSYLKHGPIWDTMAKNDAAMLRELSRISNVPLSNEGHRVAASLSEYAWIVDLLGVLLLCFLLWALLKPRVTWVPINAVDASLHNFKAKKSSNRSLRASQPTTSRILGWTIKLLALGYWIFGAGQWYSSVVSFFQKENMVGSGYQLLGLAHIAIHLPVVILMILGYRLCQTRY